MVVQLRAGLCGWAQSFGALLVPSCGCGLHDRKNEYAAQAPAFCLHGMTTSYLIVMIQTLLWLMVKWSDVNVVHSDHMCHMNLQCEMVVTDHNGCSHMFSEKGYPSVSLSVIIMFCLCSVHTCGIVLC